MKKKILVCSYSFPPSSSPESYISAKILINLTKFYDVDLITLDHSKITSNLDYSLNNYFKDKVKIYKVPISKFIEKMILLPRLPIRPDRFLLLYPSAKKILEKMDLINYSFFFTRSQYHSCHLLGLYLKKKFPKTPWITSFSDPWTQNIYQKKIPFLFYLEKIFEKRVLSKANLVISPNKLLSKSFKLINQSKTDKFKVIPHSFEEKFIQKKKKKINNEIIIRFFGKIYANRNILPFLKSLELISLKLYNIKIEFYSRWSNQFEYINSSKVLKKIIKVFPYVKYLKALELMGDSDILLIFDSDFENSLYFQSKLIDYISVKRKIFYVGNKKSFNANIVKKFNGTLSYNEIKDIKLNLIKALDKVFEYKTNETLLKEYRAYDAAKKLSLLMENLKSE